MLKLKKKCLIFTNILQTSFSHCPFSFSLYFVYKYFFAGNFVGCLADDKLPLLSGNVSESQDMRVQNCLELCEKSRYFYAGLKKT